MHYRPEIDGLRALAVVSVILLHAGLKTFRGGYVGVDVFFVISGYLITRLLATELQANGRIDLLAFYGRRARRILPALVATLAVTAVAAVALDMPQRLSEFGVTLLHEPFTIGAVIGFSMILLGSILATRRSSGPADPAAARS